MVDKLHVQKGPTTAELEFEIVERKGLGHPDTNSSGVLFQMWVSLLVALRLQSFSVHPESC